MASNTGVKSAAKKAADIGQQRSNKTVLLMASLDMSWRLAIAVLVPIIAGFELDKHLKTTPALTIVGFVVAMVATFFILKRTLEMADSKFNTGIKQ
jgi:F0F1-type ATP synthase assembly protein I